MRTRNFRALCLILAAAYLVASAGLFVLGYGYGGLVFAVFAVVFFAAGSL